MNFDFTGLGKINKVLSLIPTDDLQISFMPIAINEPLVKDILYVFPIKGRRQINCRFVFLNRRDFYYFKNFFIDCKGNYSKFWFPCWVNEFKLLQETNNDKYLYIQYCDFANRYDEHIRIFLCTKDTLYIRKVTNLIVGDTYEKLEINSPISIRPTDIIVFGRVLLVRFKESSFQVKFNLITNYKFYAEVETTLIELPYEYEEIEV